MKLITIIMFFLSLFPSGNIEYVQGVATEKWYHEDGDYCSMVIVDTNGEEWIIEDSVAALGCDCIMQIDNNGTEDLYDDEVIEVIYFQKMD